jgi:hypothetical protein
VRDLLLCAKHLFSAARGALRTGEPPKGGVLVRGSPDLRQPVTALSLGGLRRRVEALLLPDEVT